MVGAASLFREYVDGWKARDKARILATLHPACVIVESYGPIYRGIDSVERWIDAWFAEGNVVDRWDITWLDAEDGWAAAEWQFGCTWHGSPASFDGASIVRLEDQRIAYIREYQTTAPLYEWQGTWRS